MNPTSTDKPIEEEDVYYLGIKEKKRLERIEKSFWEDFEKVIRNEIKQAVSEQTYRDLTAARQLNRASKGSSASYLNSKSELSCAHKDALNRQKLLQINEKKEQLEEEERRKLQSSSVKKLLEREAKVEALRRVQVEEKALERKERSNVTQKLREDILATIATKSDVVRSSFQSKEELSSARRRAMEYEKYTRLQARKNDYEERLDRALAEKKRMIQENHDRLLALNQAKFGDFDQRRAQSANKPTISNNNDQNIIKTDRIRAAYEQLQLNRVQKYKQMLENKAKLVSEMHSAKQREIESWRESNNKRLQEHHANARSQFENASQRKREILYRNLVKLSEIQVQDERDKRMTMLKTELGLVMGQTTDLLKEKVTRLRCRNTLSLETVFRSVRDTAEEVLFPGVAKTLPRHMSALTLRSQTQEGSRTPNLPISSTSPNSPVSPIPPISPARPATTTAVNIPPMSVNSIKELFLPTRNEVIPTKSLKISPLSLMTKTGLDSLISTVKKKYDPHHIIRRNVAETNEMSADLPLDTAEYAEVSAESSEFSAEVFPSNKAESTEVSDELFEADVAVTEVKEVDVKEQSEKASMVDVAEVIAPNLPNAPMAPIVRDTPFTMKRNSSSFRGNSAVFRREFSSDHPLAGGQGKYKRELSELSEQSNLVAGVAANGRAKVFKRVSQPLRQGNLDTPMVQFLRYKHELQNFLQEAIEEEHLSEEQREEALRHVYDEKERGMMVSAINDDRERASKRLQCLVDENNAKIESALKYLLLDESSA